MEDNFCMDAGAGEIVQMVQAVNVSDGERWGAADEALLSCLPFTSCCAAQFLTGLGPVLVHDPGVGDPCSN